jgi:hypothetical protein
MNKKHKITESNIYQANFLTKKLLIKLAYSIL